MLEAIILEIRELSSNTYIIRMARNDLKFKAGQYIRLGFPGDIEKREYSIYSGEKDNYIEVLIREIEEGSLSKRFKNSKSGDFLEIEGPFGFFTLSQEEKTNEDLLFIATGTGIAPFHSFIRSYPELNYQLIHGIRYSEDTYDHDFYGTNITSCFSKEKNGQFQGRVTDYLKKHSPDTKTRCFLCGNSDMIHNAMDILVEQGLSLDQLRTEIYF